MQKLRKLKFSLKGAVLVFFTLYKMIFAGVFAQKIKFSIKDLSNWNRIYLKWERFCFQYYFSTYFLCLKDVNSHLPTQSLQWNKYFLPYDCDNPSSRIFFFVDSFLFSRNILKRNWRKYNLQVCEHLNMRLDIPCTAQKCLQKCGF